MERGQLGGLNYEISYPSQGQQQFAPQQQEQVDVNTPKLETDPLANRGKLTEDYYNNYGLLQSFAKDMSSKGVDIFKPDYSQPGGGKPFQVAQKLQAGILYAANALKNEFEFEKQGRGFEARGEQRLKQGVQREGLYYSDPNNFMSTAIDPRTIEANKRTADNVYTQRDANNLNKNVYDPTNEALGNSFDGEEQAYQQSALLPSVPETSYQQLIDRGAGTKNKSMLPFFQNITNLTRGAFEPNARDIIYRGKNWKVSDSLQGDSFGEENLEKIDANGNQVISKTPKIIKDLIKDKNGDVYIRFKDDQFDPIKVSDLPPDQVFRTLVESNGGKYGASGSVPAFYEELQKATGNTTVKPNTVFGQEALDASKSTTPVERFKNIEQDFKSKYNKVVNGELKNFNIKVPKGSTYSFSYDEDNGYYLNNWKELGFAKTVRPKDLSYEQFLAFLDNNDVLNKLYAPENIKKIEAQKPTVINKGGKKPY